MIRRNISQKQSDETLIYHELSHYLLCEISRRIEPNFTKPTKIKLSNIGDRAQIKGACYPNNITEEVSHDRNETMKLEKEFFIENTDRIFLKTIQLACGYLSSTIFVFTDHLDYFINHHEYLTKEGNGSFIIYFYELIEELDKEKMNSDFEMINKNWANLGIELKPKEWELITKYTKNILDFNPIKSVIKECFKFCMNLKKDSSFIIEGMNLLALESHVDSLLSDNIIKFYKENLDDFIKKMNPLA